MTQISLALPADRPHVSPVSLAPDPTSAAPSDEIAAWAEADQIGYLTRFFAIVADMPLDAVVAAIRTTCQRGFGLWMEPPAAHPAPPIRPATHLVEIALFGVTGSGLTLIEAAQSWRIAARRVLESGGAA